MLKQLRMVISAGIASGCLLSCTSFELIPDADLSTSGTIMRTERGQRSLVTAVDDFVVTIRPETVGNKFFMHVLIHNTGEEYVSVGEDMFSFIESKNESGPWKPVYLYTAKEYYNKREREIVAGRILTLVSAVLTSVDAGTSTSYTSGSYQSSTYGRRRYYTSRGSYSSTTTTYDSTKAALERDIAFRNVREYTNSSQEELDYLKETLFFDNDISADSEYYGTVVMEQGSRTAEHYVFKMQVGNSAFHFQFRKQVN